MSTKQTSSEATSPQEVKKTAIGLAMHSKERAYIVDSGASLHVMGFSSPNHGEKKIIRRSSKILDIQTADGIVVSDTPAKVHIEELGACPWIHLVRDYRPYCRWEDFALNFVADRRKTHRFSKRWENYRMQRRKTSSHGCISAQKAVPSNECSTWRTPWSATTT